MRLSILSNEELIDSICSSQEDAQFVFQNPEFVSRLDLYNLLKAIGNHNDLAEMAIKSGLCEKLDPDHLILIGRHQMNCCSGNRLCGCIRSKHIQHLQKEQQA